MTDILDRIESWYRKSDHGKLEAAILASEIVGLRDGATEQIAERLKVSVDTVERLACAGRMYNRVVKYAEGEAQALRDKLYVSHFCAVGKAIEDKEVKLGRADAIDLLIEAAQEGWTVEHLRSQMPLKERSYTDTVKKYYKHLPKDLINAPMLGANPKSKDVRSAAANLHEILGEYLEREKK